MLYSILLSVALLLFFGVALAQSPRIPDCFENTASSSSAVSPLGNTEIRVKTSAIIGATLSGDTLYYSGNGVVKFPIEYVNRDTVAYSGGNEFKVYGPDGATWAHATANGGNVHGFQPRDSGIWIDTSGYYPKKDFQGMYKFGLFGADGAGSDSVYFGVSSNDATQRGIRPEDSGIFFYIIIHPKLADVGKHICIDSVIFGCTWKWPAFNYLPAYNAYPAWNGPWCFVLAEIGRASCRERV